MPTKEQLHLLLEADFEYRKPIKSETKMIREQLAEKDIDLNELSYHYSKHRFLPSIVPTVRTVFEEAFIKGYQANQSKWISVENALPPFTSEISGNKLTDRVLVWNGSEQFICYLEAVRPSFKLYIWCLDNDLIDLPQDYDVDNFIYRGANITHWQPLPPKP